MKKWHAPLLNTLSFNQTAENWHQGWQCNEPTCVYYNNIQYVHGTDYWDASRNAATSAHNHFSETKKIYGSGHGHTMTCQPTLCDCTS